MRNVSHGMTLQKYSPFALVSQERAQPALMLTLIETQVIDPQVSSNFIPTMPIMSCIKAVPHALTSTGSKAATTSQAMSWQAEK